MRSEERDENDDETRRTCCLIDALKVEMRANAEALWAIVDCIVSRTLCVSFCSGVRIMIHVGIYFLFHDH